MPWYSPITWFRRPDPATDDDPQFSRRAIDSSDLPMEGMFSMRLPSDVREDGGRVARAHGFSSLAEFMRYLLNAEIKKHFEHADRLFDEGPSNALHNRRR